MGNATRRRRWKAGDLPDAGSTYLMPLANGRYGVCRVLRRATEEEVKTRLGKPAVVVAPSTWIGDDRPSLDEPSLREVLILTHHAHKGRPELIWVSEPPPPEFLPIGLIPPTAAEQQVECWSHSGWLSLSYQTLAQWRWDHDRDAVLREDEAERAVVATRSRTRVPAAPPPPLETLRNKRRFMSWRDSVAPTAIKECRTAFFDAANSLLELGSRPMRRDVRKIIRKCVERLNEIDANHGPFIATLEREELCEELASLAEAAGVPDADEWVDDWREW